MAVSVDTVYQRVLVLANKEQRGYITPQEFNLYANHAQREIYEQYFYDASSFEMKDATYVLNSDTTDLTRQKVDVFLRKIGPNVTNTFARQGRGVLLEDYIYRLSRVEVNNVEAEYTDSNRYKDIRTSGPLVRPTASRPIYTEHNRRLKISNGNPVTTNIGLHYYRFPEIIQWAYVVVNDKPLYNDNISVDFELHASEETELVYKILKLAGVNLKAPDVSQSGAALETAQVQQEKQ